MNAYSRPAIDRDLFKSDIRPTHPTRRQNPTPIDSDARAKMFTALRSGSALIAIDGAGPFSSIRANRKTHRNALLETMANDDGFAFGAPPVDMTRDTAAALRSAIDATSLEGMTLKNGMVVQRFGTTYAVIPK